MDEELSLAKRGSFPILRRDEANLASNGSDRLRGVHGGRGGRTIEIVSLGCSESNDEFVQPESGNDEFRAGRIRHELGNAGCESRGRGQSVAGLAGGCAQDVMLGVQLSPRNRRAVVVNFQLTKGVVPEATESTYSQSVLARLLLTRGQLLEKQAGAENLKLARYFIQLAAEMDPKNEDAVYASEVQRLDQGAVNWAELSETERKEEVP